MGRRAALSKKMKQRSTLVILAALFLLSFYGFSRFVRSGAMDAVDFAFTVKLQERIDTSPRLRTARLIGEIMEGSTVLVSPAVSIFAVLSLAGVLAMQGLLASGAFSGRLAPFQRLRCFARPIALLIAFGLLALGEIYGKTVVDQPAPPFFMIKNPTTVFPKYHVVETFSYPSGHAARAVFLGIVLFFLAMKQWSNGTMRKRLWVILGLGLYGGLVSISKIYLGHHWLSDVIGGGLLGGGMGFVSLALL